MLGLVRGLLSAGAQSLLLSLWDVHDQTTAQFMVSFYSRLVEQSDKRTEQSDKRADHSDKGAALQEAMLDLRKTLPHPYYWAPFVLVGKNFQASG